MIEQITPQVIAASMALVLISTTVLTAVVSAVSLWLYHRSVTRKMSALSDSPLGIFALPVELSTARAHGGSAPASEQSAPDLYQRSTSAMGSDARYYAFAVVAAAIPLSLAAQLVYPTGLGVPGFAIGVWLYAWPMVPGAIFILPRSTLVPTLTVGGYLCIYAALAAWASTVPAIPELNVGGVNLPARSGVTPTRMAILWLSVNGAPTALCLLCFNPAVRAVAPLALALVTTMLGGLCAFWLWLSMGAGQAMLALPPGETYDPIWLVLAFVSLTVALLAVLSWYFVRRIARAYRNKLLSDRSLILDALYLAFISTYTLWLALGGLTWLLCLPAAFSIYKLLLATRNRLRGPAAAPRGLCYLRVFALGRRSEGLREAIARYWRQLGPMQMITGPDVATGSVQPHQFLDFLSGKLQQHFVHDQSSLAQSIALLDYQCDPDGRYRSNNFFCYQNTWQSVLPALVQSGESLMMDLRGFSRENEGCRDELFFVASYVPLRQCVLVLDASTDRAHLNEVLELALDAMPRTSPNVGCSSGQFRQLEFDRGSNGVQRLVREMCAVAQT